MPTFIITNRFGRAEPLIFDSLDDRAKKGTMGYLGMGVPMHKSERIQFEEMLRAGSNRYVGISKVLEIKPTIAADLFAAFLNTTGEPILIKRGERGYWPFPGDPLQVRAFNERRGHTARDVCAAMVGSMFGWDVPGARPASYSDAEAEAMAYAPPAPRRQTPPDVLTELADDSAARRAGAR